MTFSNLTSTFVHGKITSHTKFLQNNVNNLKRAVASCPVIKAQDGIKKRLKTKNYPTNRVNQNML